MDMCLGDGAMLGREVGLSSPSSCSVVQHVLAVGFPVAIFKQVTVSQTTKKPKADTLALAGFAGEINVTSGDGLDQKASTATSPGGQFALPFRSIFAGKWVLWEEYEPWASQIMGAVAGAVDGFVRAKGALVGIPTSSLPAIWIRCICVQQVIAEAFCVVGLMHVTVKQTVNRPNADKDAVAGFVDVIKVTSFEALLQNASKRVSPVGQMAVPLSSASAGREPDAE
jgi:hypothetical protein